MRKTLRAIGWFAAGLAGLCIVLYLVALAINWRDEEPNAAAVRLSEIFRDRPAVAQGRGGGQLPAGTRSAVLAQGSRVLGHPDQQDDCDSGGEHRIY
jgi:hypothetical protein